MLAKRLGLRRVYVLDDGGGYWKDLLADPFRQMARGSASRIAGSATFDPEARSVRRARGAGRALRRAGRGDRRRPVRRPRRLLKALRARLGDASRSWSATRSRGFDGRAVRAARAGLLAACTWPRSTCRAPSCPLTAAGRRFAREVGVGQEPGVLEAAQATELVLEAIARSDGTRASVLERLRAEQGEGRHPRQLPLRPQRRHDAGLGADRARHPPDGQRLIATSSRGAVLDRVVNAAAEPGGLTCGRWSSGSSARSRWSSGDRVRWRSAAGKQRSLLALLLLHANEVVSTDRLIDELWGETPPPTAGEDPPGLRLAAAQGARATAGSSRARPATSCRSTGPSSTWRASSSWSARRSGRIPSARRETLRRALALWRGPALADLAYEAFAQAEIARLEELRLAALEQRIDADLAAGRHAELVGELEALVAEHPLRERLRGQLMLALYRSGRQAEALDAYRQARRELAERARAGARRGAASGSSRRSCGRTRRSTSRGRAAGRGAGAAPERSLLVVPGALDGVDVARSRSPSRSPRRSRRAS